MENDEVIVNNLYFNSLQVFFLNVFFFVTFICGLSFARRTSPPFESTND